MADRSFTVRARIEAVDAASPAVQRADSAFRGLATTLTRRFLGVMAVVQTIRSLARSFTEAITSAVKLEAEARRLGATLKGVDKSTQDVGVSAQRIASGWDAASASFGKGVISTKFLREELESLADASQRQSRILEGLGNVAGLLFAPFVALAARSLEGLNAASLATGNALDALRARFFDVSGAAEAVAVSFDRMTDGQIRAFGIQQDVEAGLRGIDSALRGLGVTIDDPVRKIEQLRLVLEEVNIQQRDFGQSRELELRAKAAADEIAKLEGRMRSQVEVTQILRDATDDASTSTDDLTQSNLELNQALVTVQAQIVRTTAEFDRLRRAAGTAAAVEAAVAGGGELVLGGTRVRLPGGGSRLTRPPGLSNNLRF